MSFSHMYCNFIETKRCNLEKNSFKELSKWKVRGYKAGVKPCLTRALREDKAGV